MDWDRGAVSGAKSIAGSMGLSDSDDLNRNSQVAAQQGTHEFRVVGRPCALWTQVGRYGPSKKCRTRTYLGSIGSRHQGRHPADDPRIAQSTGPLHEMGHLAHDLMYICILRRDPLQREV